MDNDLKRYSYNGPVTSFGVCIENRWKGETLACSERKARSNLTYQYKKITNRLPGTRIELPGEIKIVG